MTWYYVINFNLLWAVLYSAAFIWYDKEALASSFMKWGKSHIAVPSWISLPIQVVLELWRMATTRIGFHGLNVDDFIWKFILFAQFAIFAEIWRIYFFRWSPRRHVLKFIDVVKWVLTAFSTTTRRDTMLRPLSFQSSKLPLLVASFWLKDFFDECELSFLLSFFLSSSDVLDTSVERHEDGEDEVDGFLSASFLRLWSRRFVSLKTWFPNVISADGDRCHECGGLGELVYHVLLEVVGLRQSCNLCC